MYLSGESLLYQVSQLGSINSALLRDMQREILSITDDWTSVYSEYQSGGWQTLSLLNCSSDPSDTIIRDCVPVETSLLLKLPVIRSFLNELGLRYMWVRLAKLEPNAFLWEHRDYQELEDVERLRLHVPIITNPHSTLIIEGLRIHLAKGFVWKLRPTHRHGAGNLGTEARLHILIDCYRNAALDHLLQSESLDDAYVRRLPPILPATQAETALASDELARQGDCKQAEHLLLKLFYCYQLEEGACYDMISQMYDARGNEQMKELWQKRKAKFLGLDDSRKYELVEHPVNAE